MRAIIDGVTAAIDAERWRDTRQNAQLIMAELVFDLSVASKEESVRKAWEDLLVKSTREGNLEVKEVALLRLKEVKDSAIRERLREAVYVPSGRFKLAPERPE
jgi:hypothetical protein